LKKTAGSTRCARAKEKRTMAETGVSQDHQDIFVRMTDAIERCEGAEREQVRLLHEEVDLARKRTENTSNILPFLSDTSVHTEKQTSMAQERTALTREQTRLSTRSTEMANIRTDLARERSALAEQRTDLAVNRTEMARRRTSLAEGRTKLAQTRTDLAQSRSDMAHERTTLSAKRTDLAVRRTDLADERTLLSTRRTSLADERTDLAKNRTVRAKTRNRLSLQRTELARGRTYLALTRTGLAFFTLGITLLRLFGVSIWTVFDGSLLLVSLFMIIWGVRGFRRTQLAEQRLNRILAGDSGFADLTEPVGSE
jgi:uncharacterized membrane protein YidH (DUF202 family)